MHDLIAMGAAIVVAAALWLAMRRGRIAPQEAAQIVANGAQLLDVRTDDEFAEAHLAGAVHVPLHLLRDNPRLAGEPQHPIVVYCRSGARSAMAARKLRSAGFAHVFDLGPMAAWPRRSDIVSVER